MKDRPGLRLQQDPVLIDADSWSEWYTFCKDELGCPDFYVARAPKRGAMMMACSMGDTGSQRGLIDEHLVANQKFIDQLTVSFTGNELVMSRLNGGVVVYLCAGMDFGLELATMAGPNGSLFLVDYAESVVADLRRELGKHRDSFPNTQVLHTPVHLVADELAKHGVEAGMVDAVVAVRGLHRVPPPERVLTLASVKSLLKPGGIVAITELFEDDRPRNRPQSPGAWHWPIFWYQNYLRPMSLEYNSGPVLQNQDDGCRLVVFR